MGSPGYKGAPLHVSSCNVLWTLRGFSVKIFFNKTWMAILPNRNSVSFRVLDEILVSIFYCNSTPPVQIDWVEYNSWQAQVRGRKKWTFKPPPECWYECPHSHSVVVQPGNICEFISLNRALHLFLLYFRLVSYLIIAGDLWRNNGIKLLTPKIRP